MAHLLNLARKAAKENVTEAGQRNAVAKLLAQLEGITGMPEVKETRTAEGLKVRVYRWAGVSNGRSDLILVTGHDVEPIVRLTHSGQRVAVGKGNPVPEPVGTKEAAKIQVGLAEAVGVQSNPKRQLRKGQSPPRAGISDTRFAGEPKGLIPPRPDVQEPYVWSWSVQQLVANAAYAARSALLDDVEIEASDTPAMSRLRAMNDLSDRLDSDAVLKREYYDRAVYLIGIQKAPSDGWSAKGPAVDRAEARLRLWFDLYDQQVGARPNPAPEHGPIRTVVFLLQEYGSAGMNLANLSSLTIYPQATIKEALRLLMADGRVTSTREGGANVYRLVDGVKANPIPAEPHVDIVPGLRLRDQHGIWYVQREAPGVPGMWEIEMEGRPGHGKAVDAYELRRFYDVVEAPQTARAVVTPTHDPAYQAGDRVTYIDWNGVYGKPGSKYPAVVTGSQWSKWLSTWKYDARLDTGRPVLAEPRYLVRGVEEQPPVSTKSRKSHTRQANPASNDLLSQIIEAGQATKGLEWGQEAYHKAWETLAHIVQAELARQITMGEVPDAMSDEEVVYALQDQIRADAEPGEAYAAREPAISDLYTRMKMYKDAVHEARQRVRSSVRGKKARSLDAQFPEYKALRAKRADLKRQIKAAVQRDKTSPLGSFRQLGGISSMYAAAPYTAELRYVEDKIAEIERSAGSGFLSRSTVKANPGGQSTTKYKRLKASAGHYWAPHVTDKQALFEEMLQNIQHARTDEEKFHARDQISYVLAANAIRPEHGAALYESMGLTAAGGWPHQAKANPGGRPSEWAIPAFDDPKGSTR